MKTIIDKRTQKGSALVYILIAIALLAALTSTFMNSSSQQTSSQNTFNTATELNSQINFIRSAIQECVLTFPGGDDQLLAPVTPGADADEQKNHPYPIMPIADYYTDLGATNVGASTGTTSEVKDIRCPGDPGDDVNHAFIFLGTSGKFMPPAPNFFNDWQYYNGVGGVFFWIETTFTDAFLDTAMQKVADQYNECESDVVDATGGAVDFASDAAPGTGNANLFDEVECSNGAKCLRIWLKRDGANDLPDEAACN